MTPLILVVLETQESAPSLLAAAAQLGRLFGGACFDVLAVRTPPDTTIMLSEEVLTPRQSAAIREREHKRVAGLKAALDRSPLAAADGDAVRWEDIESPVDVAVRDFGGRADVIVLRRPARGDRTPARQELRTALFATGRPVLVVPAGYAESFGKRVAIAWRDDRHAVRAVIAALRCNVAPEAVFILAGVRPGDPPPKLPPVLSERGIAATIHTLPVPHSSLGAALLRKAHELAADLLVMGAYAHSPLHEAVLGGVTRSVLEGADIPVLMRH
jgi:nucleotide-binding universal stress UspA family protein